MRITNTMITNNTMFNINGNKTLVDKYNTQMTTHKKINLPSDDPVVAIRALRLRSTLSEITQYCGKNIPDAISWLETTEDAMANMETIVRRIHTLSDEGANGPLTEEDQSKILQELTQLRDQIYDEGNADFAGRTLFTGFKTNTKLTFLEDDKNTEYNITQKFTASDIEEMTYITNVKEVNYGDVKDVPIKDMPDDETVYRVRLGYTNLGTVRKTNDAIEFSDGAGGKIVVTKDPATGNFVFTDGQTPPNTVANAADLQYDSKTGQLTNTAATPPTTYPRMQYVFEYTDSSGATTKIYSDYDPANPGTKYFDETGQPLTGVTYDPTIDSIQYNNQPYTTVPALQYTLQDGTEKTARVTVKSLEGLSVEDRDKVYCSPGPEEGEVYFIPETGELIFNAELQKEIKANNCSFSFSYSKKGFDKGDLRPEHYFDCTKLKDETGNAPRKDADGNDRVIEYTKSYEDIEYTVSFNQTLKVNTEADKVFDYRLGRDVDDMVAALQEATNASKKVSDIKKMMEDPLYSSRESVLQTMLEAANREYSIATDKVRKLFGTELTRTDSYQRDINLAITDAGSRKSRVELIQRRMTDQKATFEDLKSSNEDREMSDIIIDFTSAYTTYQGSLQAAGKATEQTLLNFI